MAVDRTASTPAGILTKVGQITTSAWVAVATKGENFSKKEDVSAAVLYIFQLPAITGFRMLFQNSVYARRRSLNFAISSNGVRTDWTVSPRCSTCASSITPSARSYAIDRYSTRDGSMPMMRQQVASTAG